MCEGDRCVTEKNCLTKRQKCEITQRRRGLAPRFWIPRYVLADAAHTVLRGIQAPWLACIDVSEDVHTTKREC